VHWCCRCISRMPEWPDDNRPFDNMSLPKCAASPHCNGYLDSCSGNSVLSPVPMHIVFATNKFRQYNKEQALCTSGCCEAKGILRVPRHTFVVYTLYKIYNRCSRPHTCCLFLWALQTRWPLLYYFLFSCKQLPCGTACRPFPYRPASPGLMSYRAQALHHTFLQRSSSMQSARKLCMRMVNRDSFPDNFSR